MYVKPFQDKRHDKDSMMYNPAMAFTDSLGKYLERVGMGTINEFQHLWSRRRRKRQYSRVDENRGIEEA